MMNKGWHHSYLRLHKMAALKQLEGLYIYHIGRDELYEITEEAKEFLLQCDGSMTGDSLTADEAFVKYCLEEGLLDALPSPDKQGITISRAPNPSLRYLELQLLDRCNLRCLHCYLGPSSGKLLSLEDALKITWEFASHGGLRLLISGGEPLLYPYLKEFIRETSIFKIRRVLLTNGTLINYKNIEWLEVENIQFSLDGMCNGHELLRGKGTFDLTVKGILVAKEAGIPISIATMIHMGNLAEFNDLKKFVESLEATEWGIDVPCRAGALARNLSLAAPYNKAAPLIKYAFGGGYHGDSSGFACGRHLMTILPTGMAVKCGFYANTTLGDARKGLIDAWQKLRHIPLDKLECNGCPVLEQCAGGCRFRAPAPLAPDPVMCTLYNIRRNQTIKP